MTSSQLIVNHCMDTMEGLTSGQRIVLLRSLAVEISDELIANDCRQLANDMERAERSQRKLTLNLNAKRAAA